MDLSSITDRVRSVPPIAWVIGAGVIILVLVVGRKGGATASAGGVGTAGGGGGGGGDSGGVGGVPSDIGQQIVDLSGEIRANTAADAAFQTTIINAINGIKPGAVPGAGTGTGVGTGTGTGAGTAPTVKPRNPLWGNNIAPSIMAKYNPAALALALRRAGPGTQTSKAAYGTVINTEDIARALTRSGISYGRIVDTGDINRLLAKQGVSQAQAAAKP